jgi:hypothetical protein
MKAWEKEVYRLDLHRACLRYDIDVMVATCYNSMFLRKLEITLQAVEYNIAIYRKMKPLHIKNVSHHLLPLDDTLF